MTLPQNETPTPARDPVALDPAAREALSALVDGECRPDELSALLQAGAPPAAVSAAWDGYQVLGAALRGGAGSRALPARQEFVAGVMARLASEPRPVPHPAVAPVAPVSLVPPVTPPLARDRAAANDELWRWQLVAGVAAMAAVAAFAWPLVSNPGNASPQLAQTAPAVAPPLQAGRDRYFIEAAVPTDRDLFWRDPQVEALLAAHRQHGAMSALPVPTGFLRNVTFEPAAR